MTTLPLPATLLAETTRPGIELHAGAYVDTLICGQTYPPAEALCAFCDGAGVLACPTCDGTGADPTNPDKPCPAACDEGEIPCPQAPARWCHT